MEHCRLLLCTDNYVLICAIITSASVQLKTIYSYGQSCKGFIMQRSQCFSLIFYFFFFSKISPSVKRKFLDTPLFKCGHMRRKKSTSCTSISLTQRRVSLRKSRILCRCGHEKRLLLERKAICHQSYSTKTDNISDEQVS